jgi:hypothetical protein
MQIQSYKKTFRLYLFFVQLLCAGEAGTLYGRLQTQRI